MPPSKWILYQKIRKKK